MYNDISREMIAGPISMEGYKSFAEKIIQNIDFLETQFDQLVSNMPNKSSKINAHDFNMKIGNIQYKNSGTGITADALILKRENLFEEIRAGKLDNGDLRVVISYIEKVYGTEYKEEVGRVDYIYGKDDKEIKDFEALTTQDIKEERAQRKRDQTERD